MLKKNFSSATRACWSIITSKNSNSKKYFIIACALDILVVSLSVAAPALLKNLIDSLNNQDNLNYAVWMGVSYGVAWLFSELLLRLRSIVSAIMSEKIKNESTRRFCKNLIFKLNLKSQEMPSGVFSAKLNQTNASIPMFVDGLASQMTPLIVRLALSVSVLFSFAPPIYSALLFFTVLTFLVLSFFSYKKIGDLQLKSNMSAQEANWKILDALKNKSIIIAHSQESSEYKHMERSILKSSASAIKSICYAQAVSALQITILGAGFITITILSVLDISTKTITLGDFVQINAYILQFILPISYVGVVLSGVKRASVTIAENSAYLTEPPPINDKTTEGVSHPPAITLNKVSVVSTEGKTLLKNINLKIKSGSSLSIVGPSGAGKSTLAKSIIGLADVTSGDIFINSSRLSNDTIRDFRKKIGYVPQEPLLFDRSIWHNVFDDERIDTIDDINCLSAIGISGDKESLKARNSNNLSGGEKQRVSFARAMARLPNVIIFDEPTSSLDKETTKIIFTSIFSKLRGITRIIVTHDLEEASKADYIIVINNGEVIESGTHNDLMKTEGWYVSHWQQDNKIDEIKA